MTVAYLDPRSGETFPIDQPRWCGTDRAPLLLTPLAGIGRDAIDTGTRSLWRYRAALPLPVSDPITMGEGCTPLIPRESAWGAGLAEMRVVHAHRQLQGPGRQRDAVTAAPAGHRGGAGG